MAVTRKFEDRARVPVLVLGAQSAQRRAARKEEWHERAPRHKLAEVHRAVAVRIRARHNGTRHLRTLGLVQLGHVHRAAVLDAEAAQRPFRQPRQLLALWQSNRD